MAINTPPIHSAAVPSTDTSEQQTVVQVTVVPSLPGIPDTIDPDQTGYLGWGATVTYAWDEGIRGHTPAGEKHEVTEFLRIHSGACLMVLHATAVRIGAPPKMPRLRSTDPNEVLLHKQVMLFNPAKLPDGTPLFGVIVEAVFGLQKPPGEDDELPFPGNVLGTEPAGRYVLNPADYLDRLRTSRPVSGFAGQDITY